MQGDNEPPIFFQGLTPYLWKMNRKYRVYAVPGELIFVYAGRGRELVDGTAHMGLVGLAIRAAADPTKANEARKDHLDKTRVEDLINDHPYNFRASASEVSEVRLEPRSLYLAFMYGQIQHAGVLRFNHTSMGEVRLCVASLKDMRAAIAGLSVAFESSAAINVRWDETKRMFVKVG